MSRKNKQKAKETAEKHIDARWRFLLRNQDFQNDMQSLCDRFRDKRSTINSRENLKTSIADKYGVLFIPGEFIIYWPGYPLEAEDYPMLEYYLRSYPGGIVDYSPVITTELLDDRFLSLRVDLKHPLEDILPLTEEAIQVATKGRLRKRHRLDKVDEQLTVYDSAVKGVPFKKIASKLNLSVSTVKSIYIAAGLKIYGKNEFPNIKQLADKQLITKSNSDAHIKNCTKCNTAITFDQMCEQYQYTANKGYCSQLGGIKLSDASPDTQSLDPSEKLEDYVIGSDNGEEYR